MECIGYCKCLLIEVQSLLRLSSEEDYNSFVLKQQCLQQVFPYIDPVKVYAWPGDLN